MVNCCGLEKKAGKAKNFLYNPVRSTAYAIPELQLGYRNLNDRFGRLI
jgi:hypothetical protein